MKKLLITTLALLVLSAVPNPAQAVEFFGGMAGTVQRGVAFPGDATLSVHGGMSQGVSSTTTSTGYTYVTESFNISYQSVPLIGGTIQSLGGEYERRIWLGLWKDTRLKLNVGAQQEVSDPTGPKEMNVTFRGGLIKQIFENKLTGAKMDLALTFDLFSRDGLDYGSIGLTVFIKTGF